MEYVFQALGLPNFGLTKIWEFCRAAGTHVVDHFIPHHRNNYKPHLLGDRALALFSVMLVSLRIFTLVLVSIGPVLPAFSSAITGQNIISLTNQSRQAYNLASLK